jgi:prepilin-type N-terminal cleavage/methylation domain-containing protein
MLYNVKVKLKQWGKYMNKNVSKSAQRAGCSFGGGSSQLVASLLAYLDYGKVLKRSFLASLVSLRTLRGRMLDFVLKMTSNTVMLSDSETSQCCHNLKRLRPQDNRPLSLTLSLGERTFDDISHNLTISNLRKFLIYLFPSTLFPSKNVTHLFTSQNKKAAFTLAEVLITLGIIGVVAAITLPTLIQNYQKKTYVEGLKSGISILSQGFRKVLADEGVDDLSNTEMWKNCQLSYYNGYSITKTCETILSKYFKVAKFQSISDLHAIGDTNAQYYYTINDVVECKNLVTKSNKRYYLNDKTKCYGPSHITIMLANGMRVDLNIVSGGFYVGNINLDINGGKGPNTWGRDAFDLCILPNGNVIGKYDGQYAKAEAEYSGYSVDDYIERYKKFVEADCSSTTTSMGNLCSGRIINDGWKMNY